MQLSRYQVSTLRPPPILGVTFAHDSGIFTVATETGYEVWRTYPLGLVRRRTLAGTLARAVPLPASPLIALQGGGSNPLFPPNKAVLYHDGRGAPVAELEFSERIRGIAVRHRTIVIVLLRRAFAYEYGAEGGGFALRKINEWETAENEAGLAAVATAPGATLLALPGRQAGHVQLINLPPCVPVGGGPSVSSGTFRSPILLAHTHPLSSLACSASGAHLVTASERGTLLRVWDTARGALETELRRGVDPAEVWGAVFEDAPFAAAEGDDERRRELARRKGGRVAGWSDKGTVHIWGGEGEGAPKPAKSAQPTLTGLLSKALSLPNYFSSTASYAQYTLPRKNPHAFSSAIGAAAEAAGVPSMRINEEAAKEPEEREWAERYAVAWIEVDVEDEAAPVVEEKRPRRPTGGMSMGSREERHSFGSDATSTRTATPTLRRAETPTQSTFRGVGGVERRPSTGSVRTQPRARFRKPDKPAGAAKTRRERQLVIVTYAGDWYRLRIPRPRETDDGAPDERKSKLVCELVEYRRLGVGGGGW
ncbi:Phosphatidylinositol 3,5-bisphosphate-binding protein [Vanrija albida]|uniref:Phosphatidylinositol 3,5-bisphosphate-binding protein n=1 Tax=Vanrija albida TaxID=181172 RepID=A0ABR3QCU7_9TREE